MGVTRITSELMIDIKPEESSARKSQYAIGSTLEATTSFLTESATTFNMPPARRLKQVKTFSTDILLYSAIVGNSTENKTWDMVALTGWVARSLSQQDFICCVLYSSGSLKVSPVVYTVKSYDSTMQARQYICALNGSHLGDTPAAVTLTKSTNSECHKDFSEYLDVEYSYRYPEDIVVFGKVSYVFLSHNNPCFPCNIAIMNFLI